jgi:uncharacterized iron-regulated membrane protein
MTLKAFLFWVHRWLGIAMCLLFSLWFASGIIMMYVEYPELTEHERLANLPELNASLIRLTPLQAAASISSFRGFSSVSLTTVLDRPAYQFSTDTGRQFTVFADSGELFNRLTPAMAVAAASQSGFRSAEGQPGYDAEIQRDQWTVSAALDRHRPLHRVNINDAADTVVYISDTSGQIVRDTHRRERFWNWLGSTIHWIYPVQLRQNAPLWNQVIIVLSLIGIVSVVTGGIIGFLRIRLHRPYRGASYSPYKGMMKWHHLLGLASLVFVSTFIFSGLMSMGPWGIFDSSTSPQPQINRYRGDGNLRLADLPVPEFESEHTGLKEVRWHQIQRAAYYTLISSADDRSVGFAGNPAQASKLLQDKIDSAIPTLLPDANLLSLHEIVQYDNYYYSHHNRYRPLPVYRARFDDDESTWYHIDLTTGEIINRVTDADRLERWLFNGLHSLDFQLLFSKRPLWDFVVILLSLLGLGFSVTSVVIGWRRLTLD